jgi:hypothetical protein
MKNNNYTARVSAEAVSSIDALVKLHEFTKFRELLRKREQEYASSILNDAMDDRAREDLRQRRLELVDIIEWPERERQAHVNILASFGIQPGDGFEVGM